MLKKETLREQGFTLIEMMVAIALIGIMSAVVLPGFQSFLTGQRVTATASNIYAGAQWAKTLAIQNNVKTSLVIDSKTWCIYDRSVEPTETACTNNTNTLASGQLRKGIDTSDAKIVGTADPANTFQVTYNSLGQVVPNPNAASAPLETYTVSMSNDNSRSMVVQLALGTIRMCDPRFPNGSPQGC